MQLNLTRSQTLALVKIIVVVVIFSTVAYWSYREIRGWYDFRQAQVINMKIVQAYFSNDNPRLFQAIINPDAAKQQAAIDAAKTPGQKTMQSPQVPTPMPEATPTPTQLQ